VTADALSVCVGVDPRIDRAVIQHVHLGLLSRLVRWRRRSNPAGVGLDALDVAGRAPDRRNAAGAAGRSDDVSQFLDGARAG
jgi:hypothetical protein